MGLTAEKLGAQYGITREDCDEYGLRLMGTKLILPLLSTSQSSFYRSQNLFQVANEKGIFASEIAPMEVKGRKGTESITSDEHPRPNTKLADLTKLKAVFKEGGLVTAGSASGISDGAASLVIAGEAAMKANNLTPLARLVSWSRVGCDPSIMGIGPVEAIRNALKSAGLTLDQMDLVEINEAFAAQYLACEKELGLDRSKANLNGGAIAIGHPLGASGARM